MLRDPLHREAARAAGAGTVRLAPRLPRVPRLGIATRGNTCLEPEDVALSIERGVRYFNWCAKPDGLSRAFARLGPLRSRLVLASQLKARTASEADRELDWILKQTNSERLEVGTLYYVESETEWQHITAPGGAWEALDRHRRDGQLTMIGLTTHQRHLAARWIQELDSNGRRRLDLLMIRYNAAHTGAEQDLFPITSELGVPVVTFTGVRWTDLLRSTPDAPEGFVPPSAADCYRFCLANPAVAVALAAPNGRSELVEDLAALNSELEPGRDWTTAMRAHGRRVHRHAREFW